MSEIIKRVRPVYSKGSRTDGAVVYRVLVATRSRGSKPCKCGRIISANKETCLGCAKGEQK